MCGPDLAGLSSLPTLTATPPREATVPISQATAWLRGVKPLAQGTWEVAGQQYKRSHRKAVGLESPVRTVHEASRGRVHLRESRFHTRQVGNADTGHGLPWWGQSTPPLPKQGWWGGGSLSLG